MEQQLATKSSTPEVKTNDYRPFSFSHEPNFPIRGILHSGKSLTNYAKLYSQELQTNLEVSQSEDCYEQEAEQVMKKPSPSIYSIDFSKIPIFPDQLQGNCSNSCDQNTYFTSSGHSSDTILKPQNIASNRIQRLTNSGVLQAKLRIGQPNDIYEQEADRVAEHVMKMPDPVLHRKCTKCDEDEEKVLQAKELPRHGPVAQGQDVPPIVHEVLQSPGQPLDPATRAHMEPRFGHDFSQVRVHTDAKADDSARQVNSLAYTVGNDIVFGAGLYAPERSDSHKLLAHELVHTIQQQGVLNNEVLQRDEGSGGAGNAQRDASLESLLKGLDEKLYQQRSRDPLEEMKYQRDALAAKEDEIEYPRDLNSSEELGMYIYDSVYKQEFLNKCLEATTVITKAMISYKIWLNSLAIAYSQSWHNHEENLKSLEKVYNLYNEILIGSLLAVIPGGIGGQMGKLLKACKDLEKADFIIDGMKDLVKFELRGPIAQAIIPSKNSAPIFKPMPKNPYEWEKEVDIRALEEIKKATEALESWEHAMNNDANVDLFFDPVHKIKHALTIEGTPISDLEKPDIDEIRKKFEIAWLIKWIDLHWEEAAERIASSPIILHLHERKITNYAKNLGGEFVGAMVDKRLGEISFPISVRQSQMEVWSQTF